MPWETNPAAKCKITFGPPDNPVSIFYGFLYPQQTKIGEGI